MTREAIKEFKQIYKQEFGVELSLSEATQKAVELLELFRVLFKKDQPLDKEVVDSPS